jgi:hypothetical protein
MEYAMVVFGLALALALGFAAGFVAAALGVHGLLERSGMRLAGGRIVRAPDSGDAALDEALAKRFTGNGGEEARDG